MEILVHISLFVCESCEREAATNLIVLEGVEFSVCDNCVPNES